jgi:Uroporphyrinogen decarboxylase (URO-D)
MPDKAWTDMTADEKRAWRIDKWRNPDMQWDSPEAEAEYKARCDRLVTAWDMKVPDRVPINVNAGWWPVNRKGLTPYDAMADKAAEAMECWVEFNQVFQPDAMVGPVLYTTPAAVFEEIDYKLYHWPGHGVAKEASYQYNEKEWMLPEEYDHLISDPSDYMLRAYLPRVVGAFAGFANTTSLFDYIELPFVANQVGGWGTPEMADGLERLARASRAVADWRDVMFPTLGKLMAMGWPGYFGGASKAPFDILGDTLRGTREVIIDMYRRPEKVIAACERLVPVAIDWALKRPGGIASPVVFLPLHKGADGFMNEEQFHTFYWPTLKAVLLGLIEEGCVPFLFAEGRYGSRLEAIMDLPKGKTIWLFDQTDMARAKQTIGTVACIEGNVPLSLLYAGTVDETVAYVRHLIDVAGEGGGYILDIGAVADSGKDENLRAMIETAKEYGRY